MIFPGVVAVGVGTCPPIRLLPILAIPDRIPTGSNTVFRASPEAAVGELVPVPADPAGDPPGLPPAEFDASVERQLPKNGKDSGQPESALIADQWIGRNCPPCREFHAQGISTRVRHWLRANRGLEIRPRTGGGIRPSSMPWPARACPSHSTRCPSLMRATNRLLIRSRARWRRLDTLEREIFRRPAVSAVVSSR